MEAKTKDSSRENSNSLQLDKDSSSQRISEAPCVGVSWGADTLTIKPCVLWFASSNRTGNTIYEFSSPRFCRVHFSCHASLGEMVDLISAVNPASIEPCVIPPGSSMQKTLSLLQRQMPNARWCQQLQRQQQTWSNSKNDEMATSSRKRPIKVESAGNSNSNLAPHSHSTNQLKAANDLKANQLKRDVFKTLKRLLNIDFSLQ